VDSILYTERMTYRHT